MASVESPIPMEGSTKVNGRMTAWMGLVNFTIQMEHQPMKDIGNRMSSMELGVCIMILLRMRVQHNKSTIRIWMIWRTNGCIMKDNSIRI